MHATIHEVGLPPKFETSSGLKSFTPERIGEYLQANDVYVIKGDHEPWERNNLVREIGRSLATEFEKKVGAFVEATPEQALGMVASLRADCAMVRAANASLVENLQPARDPRGYVCGQIAEATERLDALLSLLDGSLRPSVSDWISVKFNAGSVRAQLQQPF